MTTFHFTFSLKMSDHIKNHSNLIPCTSEKYLTNSKGVVTVSTESIRYELSGLEQQNNMHLYNLLVQDEKSVLGMEMGGQKIQTS